MVIPISIHLLNVCFALIIFLGYLFFNLYWLLATINTLLKHLALLFFTEKYLVILNVNGVQINILNYCIRKNKHKIFFIKMCHLKFSTLLRCNWQKNILKDTIWWFHICIKLWKDSLHWVNLHIHHLILSLWIYFENI